MLRLYPVKKLLTVLLLIPVIAMANPTNYPKDTVKSSGEKDTYRMPVPHGWEHNFPKTLYA